MANSTKKTNATGFLYIFCTVLAVVLICIALVTVFGPSEKKDKNDKNDKNDAKLSDTADKGLAGDIADGVDSVVDELRPDVTDSKPQAPPESDASAAATEPLMTDSSATQNANAEPYEYTLPVVGELQKRHDPLLAVFSLTMNDYRAHTGIDVAAEEGSAVKCIAPGKVSDVYTDDFWGVCVEVEHDGGLKTVYRNLSDALCENVAPGCVLDGGQQIGTVGCSAKLEAADSPHLHFEVRVDGELRDPLDYVSYTEASAEIAPE